MGREGRMEEVALKQLLEGTSYLNRIIWGGWWSRTQGEGPEGIINSVHLRIRN